MSMERMRRENFTSYGDITWLFTSKKKILGNFHGSSPPTKKDYVCMKSRAFISGPSFCPDGVGQDGEEGRGKGQNF